jgi:20S proteasome alpha/beta subunit
MLAFPKPKCHEGKGVTYIAAFRCYEGVVLCADTQETTGDQKAYAEKLETIDGEKYALTLGGAGTADVVDSFAQKLGEDCASATCELDEFDKLIRKSLIDFYKTEVPLLNLTKRQAAARFIICARHKPSASVGLWVTKGVRVFPVPDFKIIGWDSPVYVHLAKRLYRPDMPMHQAVVLAVALLSFAKATALYVGGEPRVTVVGRYSQLIETDEYISAVHERIQQFNRITDDLFFSSVDLTIPASHYKKNLQLFQDIALELREQFQFDAARRLAKRMSEKDWKGDVYLTFPAGCFYSFNTDEDGNVINIELRDPEEKEQPPKPSDSQK